MRATPRPTVSTLVRWEELSRPHELSFEAHEVVRRIAAHGDLFAPCGTRLVIA